jgi:hypothetical protein
MQSSSAMDLPDLLLRTHQFAIDSFEFYKKLPKTSDAQVPGVRLELHRRERKLSGGQTRTFS